MHADAAPLGVVTALAVGDVFATSLPPGLLTTARWTGSSKLPPEYQLRTAPFSNGHLLVAMQASRVQPFRSSIINLCAGLLLAILMLTMAMVMWLVGRILQPLGKITRAAELVGRGQLARSGPIFTEYAERRDEIGGLARAQLQGSARLHTAVKVSQRLTRHLESSVAAIDGVANAVAAGAARQEERLGEVTDILGPLTKTLTLTAQGLQDAHSIVTTLSLSSSAADQTQAILATAVRRAEALLNSKEKESIEPRAMRTASVLQQASVISQAVADQREVFLKLRDSVSLLRTCIDVALEAQTSDQQHHGQHAHRATAELGRLAKLQAQEAAALRAAGELLRQDLGELHKQLASLDVRTGEDAGRLLAEERLVADRASSGERPLSEEVKRRSDRRSSQSLTGLPRRSLPGTSSSQSLAPVAGSPPERRAAVANSGSSGIGPNPLSRISGTYAKPGGPQESNPSATSLPLGPASSLSGGGSSTGLGRGGATSGTSIGGSSGNVRPVPASLHRGGATSGTSIGGSSGNVRPVPASPPRGLGASSGTSIGGSSGNVRAVPPAGPPRGGATSATSIGGSSGNIRAVASAPHSGPLKPLPSVSEGGASTRSLRPTSDSALAASAQSLNSGTPARRK